MPQYDDTLRFGTELDTANAEKSLSKFDTYAVTVAANITSSIVNSVSGAINSILSEIPKQIIAVGSQFESSMAQVAATMGITQTADEFEMLSETAKEMGESTKFSASQAADALNYLALAGFNANESCAALPTVLDLAAAGGIELAQASDMVTDSMSALGLEMDELTGFADQMAVTSQKSNTSVAQLGNAILSVGANARILAGGTNELMTELGILADAGNKGAEAGTALARVIKNLSTPTSTAKKELEKLKIECYDAEGNFRNMQDIFLDLAEATADFTEEEKQAALSEIFDTAALSSAKVLLSQCGERFDELSGYIADADGAAAQMGETMSDTLAGDVTILQSALDGLAESAYEKFAGTMRESVQSVTEDIGVLNESLKNGELSESMDKIADEFSEITSRLGEGLADDVIPAVISGFSLIIDHGNEIKAVLGGIAAATIFTKGAAMLSPFIAQMQMASIWAGAFATEEELAALSTAAVSGELSFAQTAVALFNGQISLGTAATAAFNAVLAANPLGLAAAAIGLVVTAVIGLTGKMKELSEETENSNDILEEFAGSMDEVRRKNEDDIDSSNRQIAVIKDKAKRYEELRERYKELTEGEMAEFLSLCEDLKEVLPEGTSLIDEQTGSYRSLAGSIDDVCRSMERRALLNAKYNEYEEAVSQNYDIGKNLKNAEEFFEHQSKYDPEGLTSDWTLNDYCLKQFGISYDDMQAVKSTNQKIIDEYHRMAAEVDEAASVSTDSTDTPDTGNSSDKYVSREEARIAAEEAESKKRTKSAQMSEKEKNEALRKLSEEWEEAEHKRKTGEIASDEELYAEKLRIWNRYGDAQRRDMWKFREDLIADEKEISEKRKNEAGDDPALAALAEGWSELEHKRITGEIASDEQLYTEKKKLWDKYGDSQREDMWSFEEDIINSEKALNDERLKAEEKADSDIAKAREDEWNRIEHLEDLGLLTAAEALEQRKQWIEKYCPEYSDEWYSYYKTVYDYEKELSEKQLADRKALLNDELTAVKNNVNDILSEYDTAYSKIESEISSYKSNLLNAAGSIFEISETENEDGSVTKTFKVNDIKSQIETMKKYHEALLEMKNNGAPQSLLAEMMNLDPADGLQMAEFILDSGDLESLNELYKERDDIAQSLAEDFYTDEITALNSETAARITAEYESLPAEFYDIGQSAIEQLYLGMNDASGNFGGLFEGTLNGFDESISERINDGNVMTLTAPSLVTGAASVFSAIENVSSGNSSFSGFTEILDAIKEIKIFNTSTSQLLLDGKVAAESVNEHNDTLGRMADI